VAQQENERSAPAARRAQGRDHEPAAEEQAAPLEQGDLSDEEYRKRERERDSHLPLHERRAEFLTDDERVAQVEEIDRRAPHGYSPTAGHEK
jgi:hypothetical protein